MARVDTFCCDVCGRQKKDANHWFRAYRLHGVDGIIVVSWEAAAVLGRLELSTDGEVHLCGAECGSQWVSRTLL